MRWIQLSIVRLWRCVPDSLEKISKTYTKTETDLHFSFGIVNVVLKEYDWTEYGDYETAGGVVYFLFTVVVYSSELSSVIW